MKAVVRVGVLASGRGSNFEALVRATQDQDLGARVVCLLSDQEDAPVLEKARRNDITATVVDPGARPGRLETQAETRIVEDLQSHRVDLVCLAGFMRIVGSPLLDAFPGAVLNIHPSLLPSFPGLDAPGQALRHGVKVTGCTVHLVDAGIDSGPIVLQAAVEVCENDTPETLAARIQTREHELYPRAVRLWAAGRFRIDKRQVHVEPGRRLV